MDGIRRDPKRFAPFKETFPIYLICSSHFYGWLFYVETRLDQGLHRVPLYTPCHTETDSLHPPTPPPPSHPPFQLIYTEGIVIIFVAFNGSSWFLYGSSMVPLWSLYGYSMFLYGSSMFLLWFLYGSSVVPLWSPGFQHLLKTERRFLQLLSFSQGAEGNSCLHCWEQEPSTLLRYLSSTLTAQQTLPHRFLPKPTMGKNNYPLYCHSLILLVTVCFWYLNNSGDVHFLYTLSNFTHTPTPFISVKEGKGSFKKDDFSIVLF